jgi:hypothetical protein
MVLIQYFLALRQQVVAAVVRITHKLEKLAVLAVEAERLKVLAVLVHLGKATLVDMGRLVLPHLLVAEVAEQELLDLMELDQQILLVMAAQE